MPVITGIPATVKPSAIYWYFDKVHYWLPKPLDHRQLAALRQECRGGLYYQTQPCPFDYRLRQYLDLWQPKDAALHMLAQRDGALVNYVEPACDFTFGDYRAPQWWGEFFADHHLQDHHRASMGVEAYPDGGMSTRPTRKGRPRRGRWHHHYSHRECRITGELDCFHFETRHQGLAACRKIGIHSAADLPSFDFEAHFAEPLKFYQVDAERMGRFHRNQRCGSRRSKPYITHHGALSYNHDRMLGGQLYRLLSRHPFRCPQCRSCSPPGSDACDHCGTPHPGQPWDIQRSLQQFVDAYGRGPYLQPLFDEPLLYILMRHISPMFSETPLPSAQLAFSADFRPNVEKRELSLSHAGFREHRAEVAHQHSKDTPIPTALTVPMAFSDHNRRTNDDAQASRLRPRR
jgi:hypothetical protein